MICQQTQDIKHAIVIALREDKVRDDITCESCLYDQDIINGEIIVKEKAKVAGLKFLPWVFEAVDPEVKFEVLVEEGSFVDAGTVIARLKGKAFSIICSERTALNMLQHTCGIATITSEFVNEAEGFLCDILDTRKTLPGLRALQKYAVKIGGGKNHRFHLQDAILIKNNHLKILKKHFENPVEEAIKRAKSSQPNAKIEVEVENLQMFEQALSAGADVIMLDNMSTDLMQKCVDLAAGKVYLEASGNMTKERIKDVAQSGVNGISIGALTHSVKAIDISLRVYP